MSCVGCECLDRSVTPDEILQSLDEAQRRAAMEFGAPVLIRAGAGSGKTRTVTSRIAYGIATGELDARHCLAVTFTTRAAGELRSRLGAMGVPPVAARTFHSAALRQLRFFWPQVTQTTAPQLVSDVQSLVVDAAREFGLRLNAEAARHVTTHIGWAKSHAIGPDQFVHECERILRIPPRGMDNYQVARIYGEYERIKAQHNQMDFDDVLSLLLAIFIDFPDAASQVRKQYRHITVDEFQDVSSLQFNLLRQWLGPRGDLCAVGDAAQSIYGFAGADPHYILSFAEFFPRATVIDLEQTYRCASEIVALSRRVGDANSIMLKSSQERAGVVTEAVFADALDEAQHVAASIAALIESGTHPTEIAILARQSDQLPAIAEALKMLGIAVVQRGMSDFFQRREVKYALLQLRVALANEPESSLIDAVTRVVSDLGWAEAVEDMAEANQATWDSYSVLLRLATTMHADDPTATIADLLAEINVRVESVNMPAPAAVSVMTMHAAKGLEWDTVFIVGLIDGLMPHVSAIGLQAQSEESRLLYVAVTRARTNVNLSWFRRVGETGAICQRSPLLPQLAAV